MLEVHVAAKPARNIPMVFQHGSIFAEVDLDMMWENSSHVEDKQEPHRTGSHLQS